MLPGLPIRAFKRLQLSRVPAVGQVLAQRLPLGRVRLGDLRRCPIGAQYAPFDMFQTGGLEQTDKPPPDLGIGSLTPQGLGLPFPQ